MTHNGLRFQCREEVQRFEDLLHRWQVEHGSTPFKWLSLPTTFQALQACDNGGRLFSALLDLRLNVAALECDLASIRRLVNNRLTRLELPNVSLVERPELLLSKLDLQRLNTSYILRYRAILDKIMALIVLAVAPEEYNHFRGSRSRRKKFLQLLGDGTQVPKRIVEEILETARVFDERYRTAEAHDTGAARKWTFTLGEVGPDDPQGDMFWAWNSLHPLLTVVGKLFTPV